VTSIASWSKQGLGNSIERGILDGGLEGVLGVVTMLHTHVAGNAKIIVGAGSASDKVILGEF